MVVAVGDLKVPSVFIDVVNGQVLFSFFFFSPKKQKKQIVAIRIQFDPLVWNIMIAFCLFRHCEVMPKGPIQRHAKNLRDFSAPE